MIFLNNLTLTGSRKANYKHFSGKELLTKFSMQFQYL